MFKMTVQADVLQEALSPVVTLVRECKVRLNKDGIEITAVDPSNVAMVDLDLDASACASYSADGGVIGVDLERLTDVLGMADSDDMVSLELDAETRKLSIDIGGLSYTLALIDPGPIREEPDLPDLDLPGTYVFEGGELSRAVTAADLVSDHIAIVGESDELLGFDASGDTDDVTVSIGDDDLLSGRHGGEEAVRSLFSLDYLQDIAQPIASDTDVSLQIGDEFPTIIQYNLYDGDVSVTDVLAPRIQNN